MTDAPPPFDHQRHTTNFILDKKKCLVFNDPGTGKTRSVLDAFSCYLKDHPTERMLVLCPKSIMEAAWVRDCQRFTPHLSIATAYASNRADAFDSDADIVVTNHDAVKWLSDNASVLIGFFWVAIDESTAFKNRSAQRSRAALKLAERFDYRVLMTGTPMPNSVQDIWHQALITDDGERLGANFYKFRNVVAEPTQVGRMAITKWVDKPGAEDAVADLLSDITIRYSRDECLDLPENQVTTIDVTLPDALRRKYDLFAEQALLELSSGEIDAINAGALRTKLLQIASGAVYDSQHNYHVLDRYRYELVAELCQQRAHTVVAFMWQHQKDELASALDKLKVSYALIDGSVTIKRGAVDAIVNRFQAGEVRVLLVHPKSGSHGLTLTKGTTTIWPSPTDNGEHFVQFNQRIHRAGQTERTETILIRATDTVEVPAFANLQNKVTKQLSLLDLMTQLREEAA